jgi:ABC-type spermidine/putrescine transport system permease subunit II/DNA-binding beta-propeller fold protein YncE
MIPAFSAGHSGFWASMVSAVGGAAGGVVISVLVAKRRWSGIAWVPFLVPGVVWGIVIIRVFNQPALNWVYPSVGMVIGAMAFRYLALPLQAVVQAQRSIDPDLTAAARADGASRWQAFWRVEFPMLAGPLFVAWYVAYLFCLWDAETLTLIVPPGGETLSLRVFNMLHYGHTEQVNALCIWLLGLAVAPLGVRALLAKKKLETRHVVSCGAFLMLVLSGCAQRAENEIKIESKIFSHVETFGRRGNGVGEFNKPRSLAVDGQDNVYVVDMTGRVQKFSPSGQYLLSWQMPQTDKGKPKGMCMDLDGTLIVIEPHYNRVNYHGTDGKLAYQWGTQGTNEGQLIFPRSVAVNSAGETYVSEYGMAERVQRFSSHGTNFLNAFGGPGEGQAEFRRAEGIGIDSKDRVFVADSCNHRIQVFSREGKFLAEHGKPGTQPGDLSYPYDVRVDAAGNEFVCEFGNSRVQVFDASGNFVEFIGGIGGEAGKMNNPWSICLDSKGNLYVADSGNHRVQKFVRKRALAEISKEKPSARVRDGTTYGGGA